MRANRNATVSLLSGISALAVACLLFVLAGAAAAAPAPKDHSGTAPGVELTARWWQVALATGDTSFWADTEPGSSCRTVDPPSGRLVMVAGTLGLQGVSGPRWCEIPAGATVVLPVINTAYFLTDPRPEDTIAEARAETRDVEGATVEATIDGVPAEARRIRSSAFRVNGTVFGSSSPVWATSDGYWLVWKAVPGVHHVHTFGATDSFSSLTTYTFDVRP